MKFEHLTILSRAWWKILLVLHRGVRGLANRTLPHAFVRPREFSNACLRSYGHHFSGDILNVSGWKDGDREGAHYREYFPKRASYTVSNYEVADRGIGSMEGSGVNEIMLDLNQPVPDDLRGKFDVVLNHTTLEHVIHIEQAFANLCALSRDAVIVVVPVMQQFHILPSYGDYYRMLPFAIHETFKLHGFTPLVIETNDQPFAPIYCFAIAVRDPKKYESIAPHLSLNVGQYLYGNSVKNPALEKLLAHENS
jgi:hypothetical protein